MNRLTQQDWTRMNALALAIHAVPTLAALRRTLARRIPDLLDQSCTLEPSHSATAAEQGEANGLSHRRSPEKSDSSIPFGSFTLHLSQGLTARTRHLVALLSEHLQLAIQRLTNQAKPNGTATPALQSSETAHLHAQLSRRQREVLPLLLQGLGNSEIAWHLGISSRTVEKHVAGILQTLKLPSRTALLVEVRRPSATAKSM